ncbi:hypothetical protein D3C76_1536370 [compost metagenome]
MEEGRHLLVGDGIPLEVGVGVPHLGLIGEVDVGGRLGVQLLGVVTEPRLLLLPHLHP